MYNRYVPQPDGSYRRNRMPDHVRPQPRPPKPPAPSSTERPAAPPPPPKPDQSDSKPHHQKDCGSIDGFLRQLLPKDFDVGDLIVVLLLLLMAGDSEEGRGNALTTLILYFLM